MLFLFPPFFVFIYFVLKISTYANTHTHTHKNILWGWGWCIEYGTRNKTVKRILTPRKTRWCSLDSLWLQLWYSPWLSWPTQDVPINVAKTKWKKEKEEKHKEKRRTDLMLPWFDQPKRSSQPPSFPTITLWNVGFLKLHKTKYLINNTTASLYLNLLSSYIYIQYEISNNK